MKPLIHRRHFVSRALISSVFPRIASAYQQIRVAALDWALAETMLAIGYTPIAVVAASDWHRFVIEPQLPRAVADLGLQQDINFELLASLKPDLILTSPFIEQAEPILRKIAPTLKLSIFEKSAQPLAQPRLLTKILGERLGREAEARTFLDEADRAFDLYRTRIAALRPLPVLLVNFVDPRHVRVYGGTGLYQNVLNRIGLVNAWKEGTNYWGYATVGVERLATRTDLRLLVFEPIPPDARATLEHSPLWSDLPFVRAHHVAELPTVFMFGAMPAALRFARLVVEHLESVSK